jgi:hypothetical protein
MKRLSFFRALPVTAAFCVLIAVGASAQDQPYLARVWDSSVALPPGGYRAAKPIELDNSIQITTAPQTLIDNVTFNGARGDQHWHFDGAILRRVNLSGQLGITMDAKNSVFENCGMSKTGGWFVSMWGSHWNFDNCIFTQKFLGGGLSVADYQVHATRCTFYGVKLPTISYRDDPAAYLQKSSLGFVACRFVGCNVPESFLAATVDCVFEDCEFPAKHADWPKDMSPVEVKALYSGLTDAPESYLNGPLSVRFSEAPSNVQAGSTLPHSHTADEITVTGYSPPLEYVDLGTVPKNSSEIAPLGNESSGLSGDGSGAEVVDVHSFDELLRGLPRNINLITDEQPDLDGIDAANKWLSNHFAGHNAALQIQFESGAATSDSGAAYRVISSDQSVLFSGASLTGRAIGLFPAATAGSASGMARGDNMNLRGVIKNVEIQGRGRDLALVVTIQNASAQ